LSDEEFKKHLLLVFPLLTVDQNKLHSLSMTNLFSLV